MIQYASKIEPSTNRFKVILNGDVETLNEGDIVCVIGLPVTKYKYLLRESDMTLHETCGSAEQYVVLETFFPPPACIERPSGPKDAGFIVTLT